MNFVITVLWYVFELSDWLVCLSLDLCPLWWLVGIGFEAADPDSPCPAHSVTVSVPTLRFEISWAKTEDVDAMEALMDAESDDET